jgi:hypothetical protein
MHDVHILLLSNIFKIQFVTFLKKIVDFRISHTHTHTKLLFITLKIYTNEMDAIS